MPQLLMTSSSRSFVRRLDRCVAEINRMLIGLAIGPAVFDGACFTTLRVEDALRQAAAPIAPISPSAAVSAFVR